MTPRIPAVFVWGVSQGNLPEALRTQCALHRDRIDGFLRDVAAMGFPETAALCTCNRAEVYACGDADAEALLAAFCRAREVSADVLRPYAYCKYGADAVYHLMRVASGLDSQLLGETEILGQVKRAYADALGAGATGVRLNRIFQKSFQAAKWARTQTGVAHGVVSVGNVAVELARRIFGELKTARALVFGAGEVGEKTLKALQSRGVRDVCVASRTPDRARALAAAYGAAALAFDAAMSRLAEFDIVVSSMAAPNVFLTRAALASASKARGHRPLFVIDLSVPRTVDAAAGLADVYVYDLSDLSRIAGEHMQTRRAQVTLCERGLRERALRVWQTLCARR